MSAPPASSRAETPSFLGVHHRRNERRTWLVAGVCLATLALQVLGGLAFHSLALAAGGLHMAAHVAALVTAAGAYAYARRHAASPRFAFGPGKVGDLAGFANAVVLAVTAVLIAVESLQRFVSPEAVDYASALPLALGGLALSLLCVWLLRPAAASDPDLNLSAVHLHLTGDALVGLLAVAALAVGQRFGWTWADPAAGLLGAGLVAQFALSLLRRTADGLLDMSADPQLAADARARLEAEGERVTELRLWRLGPGHHALVAVVSGAEPKSSSAYHERLKGLAGLSHVTVEVQSE